MIPCFMIYKYIILFILFKQVFDLVLLAKQVITIACMIYSVYFIKNAQIFVSFPHYENILVLLRRKPFPLLNLFAQSWFRFICDKHQSDFEKISFEHLSFSQRLRVSYGLLVQDNFSVPSKFSWILLVIYCIEYISVALKKK
jgi:hypothetical protein